MTDNSKSIKQEYVKQEYVKQEQFESIKYFTKNDIKYSLNHDFLTNEFKWLYDHIDRREHLEKYDIAYSDQCYEIIAKSKYEQLFIYIEQLPRLYKMVNEYTDNSTKIVQSLNDIDFEKDFIKIFYAKVISESSNEFIQTSKTLFDTFFDYSISEFTDQLPIDSTSWKHYYDLILYMYHTIIGFLDELEFELYSNHTALKYPDEYGTELGRDTIALDDIFS